MKTRSQSRHKIRVSKFFTMTLLLYYDKLLQHYRNPTHYGLKNECDIEMRGDNPLCGDAMTVQLWFANNIIQDVRFESDGCVVSRASASLCAAEIIGCARADIVQLSMSDVVRIIGMMPSPSRIKCAMLFLDTVQKMV